MYYGIMVRRMKLRKKITALLEKGVCQKNPGIDGILVTVGLCIIALVLCVLMKDKLAIFITTIVTQMTEKASGVLQLNG